MSDDGRTIVIGSGPRPTARLNSSGSAYVFSHTEGDRHRQTELIPTNRDENEAYGMSVDISADGKIAIVGVPGDKDPHGPLAGSASVFVERDGQ